MKQNIMKFKRLARTFERLEETSSNLKMIDILADFFDDVSPEEARMSAYLLRGEIAPSYQGPEFGMGKKLTLEAVAAAVGKDKKEVQKLYNKKGDLGLVAEEYLGSARGKGLSLKEVFGELNKIAHASGTGSQEEKINTLRDLLKKLSPIEARYVVRTVVGALRLGVGEMTFLYGLSKALTGSKEKKKVLEHAFNVFSDLGEVAHQAVKRGVGSLEDAKPVVGVPVRMMLAQRTETLQEAQKHIPGEVHVEYKYDGERIQAHIPKRGEIMLFSRRHENISSQFPDVIESIRKAFKGRKDAIVEGEVVAIDKKTGKLKNFQVLMQRRRKYDIEEYVKKVPVRYFLFDVIHFDGKSLLKASLSGRKEILEKQFPKGDGITVAKYTTTKDLAEIESFFAESMSWGGEGVMIKDAKSQYQAGTRGWNWIKFKKEYKEELADTFDLVVIGGLHGTGKRAGTYGSLLVASYDPNTNKYYSFTKVGAGFTDEDLAKLPKMLNKYRLKERHKLVETGMEPDVWFEPVFVMEISGADITISPSHTVAKDKVKKGGLALRFPRFLRWRGDKKAEQTTTVKEIYSIYKGVRGSAK